MMSVFALVISRCTSSMISCLKRSKSAAVNGIPLELAEDAACGALLAASSWLESDDPLGAFRCTFGESVVVPLGVVAEFIDELLVFCHGLWFTSALGRFSVSADVPLATASDVGSPTDFLFLNRAVSSLKKSGCPMLVVLLMVLVLLPDPLSVVEETFEALCAVTSPGAEPVASDVFRS